MQTAALHFINRHFVFHYSPLCFKFGVALLEVNRRLTRTKGKPDKVKKTLFFSQIDIKEKTFLYLCKCYLPMGLGVSCRREELLGWSVTIRKALLYALFLVFETSTIE